MKSTGGESGKNNIYPKLKIDNREMSTTSIVHRSTRKVKNEK